jgi:hypothetical protein
MELGRFDPGLGRFDPGLGRSYLCYIGARDSLIHGLELSRH